MKIIEPLENEPATTSAAATEADETAESDESEFASWDE